VLLGDPAARLPVQALVATRPASVAVVPSKPALPLPIDRLEEAIAQVILGDKGIKGIAAEYGLERGELEGLAARYQAAGRRALEG